jgi:hypothetical protein
MKQEIPNEHSHLRQDTLSHLEHSKSAMSIPEGYFEANAAMLESALVETLETPQDYFDRQATELEQSLHAAQETPTKVRSMQFRWIAAAAAVVAGVMVVVVPKQEEVLNFSEQLEQSDLEFEDLEELELDEELFEELIVPDTIIADTVVIEKLPASINDFKPSKGQSVISWDDIDAKDIEEYLKEERSLNIIDEL